MLPGIGPPGVPSPAEHSNPIFEDSMPIPRSQCDAWQSVGATKAAQATHEAVRAALAHDQSSLRGRDFEVFLQGSYRNGTNVRGDSDVDVVVQLNQIYHYNTDTLPPEQLASFKQHFSPASYSLSSFDNDVQASLVRYFGAGRTKVRNKCITVSGGSGTLDADVVVAAQYRRYKQFGTLLTQDYSEGITFWGRQDHLQIINYPKLHYANGVTKNSESHDNYKPAVRMFKNARTFLVENGKLAEATAPSYFIECLLFNAPANHFVDNSFDTFYNILNWLHETTDWSKFVCQNWEYYLFGSSNVQWSLTDAKTFKTAVVALWNEWGK